MTAFLLLLAARREFAFTRLQEAFREHFAGEPAVRLAGARLLAADNRPRGKMLELDAGGGLVDLLAAGARTAHEGLLDVGVRQFRKRHAGLDALDCLGSEGDGVHGKIR